jgi:hypothetical protein
LGEIKRGEPRPPRFLFEDYLRVSVALQHARNAPPTKVYVRQSVCAQKKYSIMHTTTDTL